MRITVIAPFALRPKGTTRERALPLARALAARGHRVRVIIPPWDNPSEAGRCWQEAGVEVESVTLPRPLLPRLPLLLAKRALASRPDVIHVFKPKAYSGLAADLLRVRHARWVLDHDDWEGRGGWNERNQYSLAQRLLFQWQEQHLPRRAAAVTVASRTLETQVWGQGVAPGQVFYLPNGAEHAKYDPWVAAADEASVLRMREQLGIAANPTLLLYTRFVEFPPARVVELLKRLAAEMPAVRLLVLGSGFFGEENDLQGLAAQAGLASCIVQRPIQPADLEDGTLARLICAADIGIFPMNDNLVNRAKCPVRVVDMMALGLPIVAERVGQMGEYLEHNVSGLLIEPGNVAEFAQASLQLLQSSQLRTSIGAAARAQLWSRFDWAILAEQAERAYASTGL
ncbi:MAG: glycosyl transferase family 1 [Candidatus Chloroheliales bacterium]|nr:MAG: glycosyl transferase family 1 [Chloroflexota bacterium]